MAKTGFWLRGAKGKLAGATIYKSGTGTVMREVVSPRNPRSNGQMIQRAIMATVMKAYSAGKDIFNHSFQGKAVGMECQREFMAQNLAFLRQDLPLTNSQARVIGPKALSPVPNSYIVSRGSYAQTLFGESLNKIVSVAGSSTINYRVYIPAPLNNETFAKYFERVGLVNGDIYTLVAFGVNTESVEADYGIDDNDAKQYSSMFGYIRMVVNNKLTAAELEESSNLDTLMSKVFDISSNMPGLAEAIAEKAMTDFTPSADINYGFSIQSIVGTGYNEGAIGCIRSREDQDLRSNTQLSLITPVNYGISFDYLLPIWKKSVDSLASSDLILEGGSGSTRRVPSIVSQVPRVTSLTFGSRQLPTDGSTVEISHELTQRLAGTADNIPTNGDCRLRVLSNQTGAEYLTTITQNGAFNAGTWNGVEGDNCRIQLFDDSSNTNLQDIVTVIWT